MRNFLPKIGYTPFPQDLFLENWNEQLMIIEYEVRAYRSTIYNWIKDEDEFNNEK